MKNKFCCGVISALVLTTFCSITSFAGSWTQSEKGWHYLNDNGTYVFSQWIEDKNNWYYIDSHGIMQTGWLEYNDAWYYLESDGHMVSGYQEIRGIPYEFHSDGRLKESPGNPMEYSTPTAPNVTAEMCTADFWIERTHGAGQLLLTEDEINSLNQEILKTKATSMYDLPNLSEYYNGRKMADAHANFKSPKGLFLNGQPVPETYYEAIRSNIRSASVSESMPLRYGFAVNRTLMKAYPYSDFLSDSLTDVEWDNLASAPVRVNEPLAVYFYTADGKYALVRNSVCSGWVPTEDIAICKDKAEWLNAQQMEQFLVVTGEKIYLEAGTAYPEASEKCLTMGTVLELASGTDELITNRLPWNSYVVKLPHRNPDGSFSQKKALIPANRDVNAGYLPFTSEGIIRQAFKCLGNRYGWGGMLNSQDCSGLVMDIYKCFGLQIPRNTTWQAAMPVNVTNLSGMTDAEKDAVLNTLRPGAIIQFPGHEMLYLGKVNGRHYTINDVSSLVSPQEGDTGTSVLRVRSVIVNDLSTRRGSGKTWHNQLSKIITVWE